MIHNHAVSMRDLLRNPTANFPQQGQSVVVTKGGFPMYQINALNISASLSGGGGGSGGNGISGSALSLTKEDDGEIKVNEETTAHTD